MLHKTLIIGLLFTLIVGCSGTDAPGQAETSLASLSRDDLKALVWANDIAGLQVEEGDYTMLSDLSGFITEARFQGTEDYFLVTIGTYESHQLAVEQAKLRLEDINQLANGAEFVIQIPNVGDLLYVGRNPSDDFTVPSFVLARCGIVVESLLSKKYPAPILENYAKAIDQRIQAKCSQ